MSRTPESLTEQERTDLLAAWNAGLQAESQLAQRFDLKISSMKDAVHRWGGISKRSYRTATPKEEPLPIDQQVQHDRELQRIKGEARHYQNLYKAAIKDTSNQEALVETMKDAVLAMPTMSMQPIDVPKGRSHGLHSCVGVLSDIHVGESVDVDVMGGLGEYNIEIFRQRAGLYVRKFLYLLDMERNTIEVPRLHLFLDGDFISGLIHDELLKTNASNVMEQTTLAAAVGAWVIAQLAVHFEEVYVSGTVGNHGRNQQKIEFKDPYVNWDYICYQLMAMMLRDYTHIQWDIPKGLWALTQVENMKFFHYHGHNIRSWMNTPYYGIEKAIRDIRDLFNIADITFDGVVLGHFHHYFEKDLGTGPLIINGCWKGGDEFVLYGLRKLSKPSQTMFYVHAEEGYVGSRLIHLWGQQPSDADGVPTHAEPVWANQNI